MKHEKLYKMGEIVQYSGLSRQVLHNYTLAGLIIEAKRTPSGHRLYDESVFERLEKIKVLKDKNYTLMQIKKLLEHGLK
ncbi:MAG: MerR family transcriptional regulator [Candidatus Omnitrophica bacterium]|nr:MerR family transcriptional regulator [Candidatus Omnitrophota bacterium]